MPKVQPAVAFGGGQEYVTVRPERKKGNSGGNRLVAAARASRRSGRRKPFYTRGCIWQKVTRPSCY